MPKRKTVPVDPQVAIAEAAEALTQVAYRWFFAVAVNAQQVWRASDGARIWFLVPEDPTHRELFQWAANVGWLELRRCKRSDGTRAVCVRCGTTEPASIMLRLSEAPRGLGSADWPWEMLLGGLTLPIAGLAYYMYKNRRKGTS